MIGHSIKYLKVTQVESIVYFIRIISIIAMISPILFRVALIFLFVYGIFMLGLYCIDLVFTLVKLHNYWCLQKIAMYETPNFINFRKCYNIPPFYLNYSLGFS